MDDGFCSISDGESDEVQKFASAACNLEIETSSNIVRIYSNCFVCVGQILLSCVITIPNRKLRCCAISNVDKVSYYQMTENISSK
jgi:hypothetical protein